MSHNNNNHGDREQQSFDEALTFLTHVAGEEIAHMVSRGKSTRVKGVWQFKSVGGVVLADVDTFNHVASVHAMPDLRGATTAQVQTTRVICQCGQPKVLLGRAPSGTHYRCSQCKRVVFVR